MSTSSRVLSLSLQISRRNRQPRRRTLSLQEQWCLTSTTPPVSLRASVLRLEGNFLASKCQERDIAAGVQMFNLFNVQSWRWSCGTPRPNRVPSLKSMAYVTSSIVCVVLSLNACPRSPTICLNPQFSVSKILVNCPFSTKPGVWPRRIDMYYTQGFAFSGLVSVPRPCLGDIVYPPQRTVHSFPVVSGYL